MRTSTSTLSLALTLLAALACEPAGAQGAAPRSPNPSPIEGVVRVDTVARGLVNPWALAFLPDGRILVTERPGRLRIVSRDGTLSQPIAGVPEVAARGQGGLLDVALDPRFDRNRLIYLSYSEPGENGTAGTAVARARLGNGRLEDVRVIFRQRPKTQGASHFGSRLVFNRDGTLFVTLGDRGNQRQRVQDLSSTVGKVVRINTDGTVPRDNPFVGRAGALPEIWSYGHRNIQAAALHPETGQLWEIEHGPRGGDELNLVEAAKNYGWPTITYGIEYSGGRIAESAEREGMEQPVYYWDPVIAPSGMTFLTSDRYPGWKGSLFVGSLQRGLVRLVLENGRVASEERHLGSLGTRIRDVQQGPDGLLYVVTDTPTGYVLRVVPAAR